MGRPVYTSEQVEEGRRLLCEAALKLYRAQGYEAVTLREIGAEAGVSSATPYRYFESKEALFAQVRAMVYQSFGDYLQKADPKRGDPLRRLRKVATGMVRFGLERPDDYRLIFSMRQPPMARNSPLFIARQRTLDHVIPICQEIIDSGRMGGNALVQVHVAWAALHGVISFHVSNQLIHGCEMNEIVDPLLDRLFAPSPSPAPAKPLVRKAAGKIVGKSGAATSSRRK